MTSGRYCAGSVSSCSRKTPSAVILPSAWRSAEHDTAMRDRAGRAVARQADHAHVVAEVLAAELRADAELLRELRAPAASSSRSRKPRPSVVAGRRAACRGSAPTRASRSSSVCSADVPPITTREVVRRAGRGAERAQLLVEEAQQARRVEQRLRLLEQEALVGRAAALGHEQELVRVAVDRVDLDLGRQVGAGVHLLAHVERRHLRVAQVVVG